MVKRPLHVLAIVVLLLLPFETEATTSNFNVLFFQNTVGPNRYLMLHDTETLRSLQLYVAETAVYGYRPFQIFQLGQRVQGVIDHELESHFSVAFGVLPWLQAGFDLPVMVVNKFQSPTVIPGPGTTNHVSLSDLRFEMKARLVDLEKHPFGVAVVPFMSLPTGKSSYFVGDSTFTGGVKLALEAKPIGKTTLALNTGYQGGEHVLVRNIDYQHRILAGAGVHVQANDPFSLFGTINTSTTTKKFFSSKNTTPAEALGGATYEAKKIGLAFQGGVGTCLSCGVGGAYIRAVFNVAYRPSPFSRKAKEKEIKGEGLEEALQETETPKAVEAKPAAIHEAMGAETAVAGAADGDIATLFSITFEFNRVRLRASQKARLRDAVAYLNEHPAISHIEVGGHADNRGTKAANFAVSKRRAQVVLMYLRRHGLRHEVKLVAQGYGAEKPLVPNTTRENRTKNRRVVLRALSTEAPATSTSP